MKQHFLNFALTKYSKARQTRYFSGVLLTLLFAVLFTDAQAQGLYVNGTGVPFSFDDLKHSTTATTPVTHAKGAESVSLSGGATYTLPIAIAPGTGGMQPTLAVTYNSQSGVSNMGMGWSLAAGSAIVRTNKTVAQDGAASAPTLAQTDAIALDGQRLVLLSGTYGLNGSVYTTENEAYSRITLYGDLASTNAYFYVLTKNGMTIEYGTNYYDYVTATWVESNAALKASATAAALLWRISKTTDAFGNFMTYQYEDGTTTRSSYLTEIKYTGNANVLPVLTPYNKVTFTYNARTVDATTSYMCGAAIKNDKKLTTITAFAENVAFRKYDFTYSSIAAPALATDPSIPRTTEFITKITESNVTTGTTFVAQNPVYFKYGDVPVINTSTNLLVETTTTDPAGTGSSVLNGAPTETAGGFEYMSGDYNGDGYTDLLEFSRGELYERTNDCYKQWLFGPSCAFKSREYNTGRVLLNKPPSSANNSNSNTYKPGFYNSNGTVSLRPGNGIVGNPQNEIWQEQPNGCGGLIPPPVYTHHYFCKTVSANSDIDGDGKDDLVVSWFDRSVKFGAACKMSEDTKFIGVGVYTKLDATPVYNFYSIGNYPWKVREDIDGDPDNNNNFVHAFIQDQIVEVGDFTGDGRADIIAVEGMHKIHLLSIAQGSSFNYIQTSLSNYDNFIIKSLDINGDGKTELSFVSPNGMDIIGFNSINSVEIINHNTIASVNGYHPNYQFGDFNGDGKSDVINGFIFGGVNPGKIYYSIGRSFTAAQSLDTPTNVYADYQTTRTIGNFPEPATTITTNSWTISNNRKIVADFNGDGKADIIYATQDGENGPNRLGFYFSTGNGFVQTYKNINSNETAGLYWNSKPNDDNRTDNGNLGNKVETMGIGDFNADGQLDFLSRNTGASSVANILYVLPNQRHHLLHKVKDGLDNVTEFQYRGLAQPLRTNQNFRMAGKDSTQQAKNNSIQAVTTAPPPTDPVQSYAFPMQIRQRAMTVVQRVTVPSGSDDLLTTRSVLYQYGLPVMNAQRGFFGFTYTITRDSVTQIQNLVATTYDDYGASLMQITQSWLQPAPYDYRIFSRGKSYSERKQISMVGAPQRYLYRPNYSESFNFTNFSYTTNITDYDASTTAAVLNNPIKVTNESGSWVDDGNGGVIKTIMATEITDFATYVPAYKTATITGFNALPSLVTTQKTVGTSVGLPTVTKYTYLFGTTNYDGNPRKVETYIGKSATNSAIPTKDYTYDVFGNMLSEKSTSNISPITSRTTRHKYEAKGRFVTHIANPLSNQSTVDIATLTSQVVVSNYLNSSSIRFGVPISTKDVAGLQTNYTYDAFGRVITVAQPISADADISLITTTNYSWATSPEVPQDVYSITQTEMSDNAGNTPYNCSAATTTYIDALERPRLTTTTNLQGSLVYTGIVTFDQQGRQTTQKAAYLAGASATALTTYNQYYDATNYNNVLAQYNQLRSSSLGASAANLFTTNTITYQNIPGVSGGLKVTTQKVDIDATDGVFPTQTSSKTVNQLGLTIETTDDGGTMYYKYSNLGLTNTYYNGTAATNEIMTVGYDSYNRRISLADKNVNPDIITKKTLYTYTPFGELASQTDTKGNRYEMKYDSIGRLIEKKLTAMGTGGIGSQNGTGSVLNEKTTYTYSPVGNIPFASPTTSINQLIEEKIEYPFGAPLVLRHKKTYTYNTMQQTTQVDEIIKKNLVTAQETFTTKYSYDGCGRNYITEYPKSTVAGNTMPEMRVMQTYTEGHLTKVERVNATNVVQSVLFKPEAQNAFGKYTAYKLNGISASNTTISVGKTYNAFGFPSFYTAGSGTTPSNFQKLSFKFEATGRNLTERKDELNGNKTETFSYDALDRLISNVVKDNAGNPIANNNTEYATNGNITYKSDVGDYVYDASSAGRPHAVTTLTTTIPAIMDWQNRKQQILYTAYEQPSTIKEFTSAANTTYNQLDYTYGTHENRVMSIEFNSATPTATTTRYYIGNYERLDNGTSKRHIYYIGAAIITYDENTVTGPNANVYKTYYALTDHQGSILKVIDANGTSGALSVAAEYNYDAWGRNRNVIDVGAVPGWTYPALGAAPSGINTLPWLTRGYTGHEHLRTFALINMNGRMYDPALGQMLSPDNFAGLDGTTQSYNRYSYVMNNPLKYTDPSGEIAVIDDILIGAAVGAGVGGAVYAVQHLINNNGSFNNWSWGGFGKAVAVGAVSGAVSGGLGPVLEAAHIGGALGGAIMGGASGFAGSTTSALLNNESGQQAFNTIAMGTLTGIGIGGLTGGIDAEFKGQRFWDGKGKITHQKYIVGTGSTPDTKQANISDVIDNSEVFGQHQRQYVDSEGKVVSKVENFSKNKGGGYRSSYPTQRGHLSGGLNTEQFEGNLTLNVRAFPQQGQTFNVMVDGQVYRSYTQMTRTTLTVPAGKSIGWNMQGVFVGKAITPIPGSYVIAQGTWRSWGGFLFW